MKFDPIASFSNLDDWDNSNSTEIQSEPPKKSDDNSSQSYLQLCFTLSDSDDQQVEQSSTNKQQVLELSLTSTLFRHEIAPHENESTSTESSQDGIASDDEMNPLNQCAYGLVRPKPITLLTVECSGDSSPFYEVDLGDLTGMRFPDVGNISENNLFAVLNDTPQSPGHLGTDKSKSKIGRRHLWSTTLTSKENKQGEDARRNSFNSSFRVVAAPKAENRNRTDSPMPLRGYFTSQMDKPTGECSTSASLAEYLCNYTKVDTYPKHRRNSTGAFSGSGLAARQAIHSSGLRRNSTGAIKGSHVKHGSSALRIDTPLKARPVNEVDKSSPARRNSLASSKGDQSRNSDYGSMASSSIGFQRSKPTSRSSSRTRRSSLTHQNGSNGLFALARRISKRAESAPPCKKASLGRESHHSNQTGTAFSSSVTTDRPIQVQNFGGLELQPGLPATQHHKMMVFNDGSPQPSIVKSMSFHLNHNGPNEDLSRHRHHRLGTYLTRTCNEGNKNRGSCSSCGL